MIQYVVTNERVGATRTLYADYSARVQGLVFASNNRGFAECTGFVPMGASEAFGLFDSFGPLRVQVVDSSSGVMFDGRLEDVAITGDGATLTALGFSRALSDNPYTAPWSSTRFDDWDTLTAADIAATTPEKYNIDHNNRIYVGLQKNTVYLNTIDYGIIGVRRPSGSSRGFVGLHVEMTVSLPTGWQLLVSTRDDAWGGGTTIDTIAGGVGVSPMNRFYTFASTGAVTFLIYNNSGANYTNALENGVSYLNITNLRVVSSTTNKVDTTTTAAIAVGSGVSVPVVSSARMYVGQRLHMGIPAALGFNATVLSIPDATHFTADISTAMASGGNVQAHVIYADEIAKDLASVTSTLNSGQLSSSTSLITSPALDLFNESYEDRAPVDVLDYLASIGDSTGNPWEWGVRNDQRLYFRPQGTNARTWYIDVSELDIRRVLDQLSNSIYAVYQDANGRNIRATATSDPGSVARYGLTRRAALPVSSTSAAQAALQQATALADRRNPQPQSGVTVDRVFDANGSRWPLWYVQAGDTMVIRNLAPTLSTTIDRIRIFRLARVEYSFDDDTLNLEPETPLPTLDALLAKQALKR